MSALISGLLRSVGLAKQPSPDDKRRLANELSKCYDLFLDETGNLSVLDRLDDEKEWIECKRNLARAEQLRKEADADEIRLYGSKCACAQACNRSGELWSQGWCPVDQKCAKTMPNWPWIDMRGYYKPCDTLNGGHTNRAGRHPVPVQTRGRIPIRAQPQPIYYMKPAIVGGSKNGRIPIPINYMRPAIVGGSENGTVKRRNPTNHRRSQQRR
jgi:hypothetical protein